MYYLVVHGKIQYFVKTLFSVVTNGNANCTVNTSGLCECWLTMQQVSLWQSALPHPSTHTGCGDSHQQVLLPVAFTVTWCYMIFQYHCHAENSCPMSVLTPLWLCKRMPLVKCFDLIVSGQWWCEYFTLDTNKSTDDNAEDISSTLIPTNNAGELRLALPPHCSVHSFHLINELSVQFITRYTHSLNAQVSGSGNTSLQSRQPDPLLKFIM